MGLDLFKLLKEERGVTVIMVALLILVFIGVAAMAIDIGHLFVVRNELQNAADAGCLAGARFLYSDEGMVVNENVNQIAYQAAITNKSEKAPVDVHWSGGNVGDVERGHWCFTTRTFTPNESIQPINLWDVSPEELDANPNFINAIRVRARRQDTPAASFFARIFGYENFSLSTEAIAYVGFAGTLAPGEAEQPVAICRESLLVNEKYSCTIGRVISIGTYLPGQETGGWTDFSQDSPCLNGTNAQAVIDLLCRSGNPDPIILNQPITANGGDIPFAFGLLRTCWESITGRTHPWTLTLPVIECPGNNVDSCARVVGAVTINIVWITGADEDPTYSDAPWVMEDPRDQTTWSSNDPDGQVRWNSFVQNFNLQNIDGSPVPYQKKAIYFLPDCNYHKPAGRAGGENFGVLAKIPVLAK
jgi:hypothetical protein